MRRTVWQWDRNDSVKAPRGTYGHRDKSVKGARSGGVRILQRFGKGLIGLPAKPIVGVMEERTKCSRNKHNENIQRVKKVANRSIETYDVRTSTPHESQ